MNSANKALIFGNTALPDGSPDRPLVTFAVFAYNQETFVREAVEGAFSQTYEPLEIILSDDCSSDGTFDVFCEMAAAYQGRHLVRLRRNKRNLGLASHINAVLNEANGEIISWAAGDDVAHSERTSIFVSKLLECKDYVGVHSDVEEIDLEGHILRIRKHAGHEANTSLHDVILNGRSVITQSHAFRRNAYDSFGHFRRDLTQEGIAMAFREALLGKVAFVDRPLTKYRVGCGVSTYSGRNVARLQYDEPIKIANWYLSAYRQMYDDSLALSGRLPSAAGRMIQRRIMFYMNLSNINHRFSVLSSVIINLLLFPRDFRSLRAAIRVLLPSFLYGFTIR